MDGICERRSVNSAVSVFLVFVLVWGTFTLLVAEDAIGQEEELILRIGSQDEMKTRNILASNDIWTENVLGPVYDSVLHTHPETGELLPYILKGTDVNGNGVFDESEYGIFTSVSGNPLEITAFYDFNWVLFHDGYQATVEDVLFTYHLDALSLKSRALDVLKDKNNIAGNYTVTKWLWVNQVKDFDSVNDWSVFRGYYGNPNYNASLRAAVHFVQQVPYWNFYHSTLSWRILPRHLWEGTGCIYEKDQGTFTCDIHRKGDGLLMDFGFALDPATGNGNPGPTPKEFDFGLAESWDVPDEHVIGTGPFEFGTWQKGAFSNLTKFEDFYEGEPYMHRPFIDGMLFKIYKTTQTAVFALKSGDIDYIAYSIFPDFVPDLLSDPNIEIVSTIETGFTHLSYNMRNIPFGYPDGDPANGDVGKNFRKAVSYLIDRKTIVVSLLQNFGVAANGPVSPFLTKWFNSSLPVVGYDPTSADVHLDTYDPWEPSDGPCLSSGMGCRSFPGIGTSEIEIMTPPADYDPILAASGNLIAQAMRAAGINARAVPTAYGEIIMKIDARDFEMYLLDCEVGPDPPDYLFDLFYSRNKDAGQNYPGYQSDEFDNIIIQAREELDSQQQASLIEWSQGILANDRPIDTLFHKVNIEAYRSDRYVNWTVGEIGSIYWYWSWLGIHPPFPEPLRITTSMRTSVATDETVEFVAAVRDPEGTVLSGATVQIYVIASDGNFTLGPVTSNAISGLTDLNGELRVTYNPPPLNIQLVSKTVLIHARATHPSYNESRNSTTTVLVYYPDGTRYLSLLVELLEGDLVLEGRTTQMRVQVTEHSGSPVSGANVTISSMPPADFTPQIGVTDVNGHINGQENVEFEAPSVDSNVTFVVTVEADKTGYVDTSRILFITVKNNQWPTISITSISPGQIVGGVVNVSGFASDPDNDSHLVGVEVSIDGGAWQNAIGTTSWWFELNTLPMSNDSHMISARSFDGVDYSIPASVDLIVDNANHPPSVSISSPSSSEIVSDVMSVIGTASDPDGDSQLVSVELRVDDSSWQNVMGTTSWTHELDTWSLSNGDHTLYARSYDGIVYSSLASVSVVVDNNRPPIVSITSISPGDVLSGVVLIEGDASDPDGDDQLERVQIRIDDKDWENASGTSQWSLNLDTTLLDNGNHTIYARAYDGREYSQVVELTIRVQNEIQVEAENLLWLWITLAILVAVVVAIILLLLLQRRRKVPQLDDLS